MQAVNSWSSLKSLYFHLSAWHLTVGPPEQTMGLAPGLADWNQTSEGRRWPAPWDPPAQFKVTCFKQPSPPHPMAFKAQTALLPGARWGSARGCAAVAERGRRAARQGPLHPVLPGLLANEFKVTPLFDFWHPTSARHFQSSVRVHTQRILSRNTVNSQVFFFF